MLPWLNKIYCLYGMHFIGILICGEKDDGVGSWAAAGLCSTPQKQWVLLDIFAERLAVTSAVLGEKSLGTGFGFTRAVRLTGKSLKPMLVKAILLCLHFTGVGQLFPLLHGFISQATPSAHVVGVCFTHSESHKAAHPTAVFQPPLVMFSSDPGSVAAFVPEAVAALRVQIWVSSCLMLLEHQRKSWKAPGCNTAMKPVLANGWAQVN